MEILKNAPECFLQRVEDDSLDLAVDFEVLTEGVTSPVRCVCCFSVG